MAFQQPTLPAPPFTGTFPIAPGIINGPGSAVEPVAFMEFGEMRFSPTIGKLMLALSKVQGAIAKKDRAGQVGNQRTKYADLAACWDVVQKPLEQNELAIPQVATSQTGERCSVHTLLGHSSGEWMAGILTLVPTTKTPQGIGSAITYARRYALCGMLGIAPDDDDGTLASATPKVVPGFGTFAPTHGTGPAPDVNSNPQNGQIPPVGVAAVRAGRMMALGPIINAIGISLDAFHAQVYQLYGTNDVGQIHEQQYGDLYNRLTTAAQGKR